MGKLAIINGSPRVTKSNSKIYADYFKGCYNDEIIEYYIYKNNFTDICLELDSCSNILFVFPLYIDSIPVKLLDFLKHLEEYPLKQKPQVNMIINCGFIEYTQNEVAVEIIQLFCKQNNYTFGSYLSIGSGEAIIKTPFMLMVKNKIKKLAKAIKKQNNIELFAAMPLPKKIFLKASIKFWTKRGKKNGITREQMQTMNIEH